MEKYIKDMLWLFEFFFRAFTTSWRFLLPTICRFSPPLRENDIKYMRSLLQAIFPMLLIGKITISLEKYIENKKFFFDELYRNIIFFFELTLKTCYCQVEFFFTTLCFLLLHSLGPTSQALLYMVIKNCCLIISFMSFFLFFFSFYGVHIR